MSPFYFRWTSSGYNGSNVFVVNGSSDPGYLSSTIVNGTDGGVRPEISLGKGKFIVSAIVE